MSPKELAQQPVGLVGVALSMRAQPQMDQLVSEVHLLGEEMRILMGAFQAHRQLVVAAALVVPGLTPRQVQRAMAVMGWPPQSLVRVSRMGAAAEAEREFLTVQRALEPMAAVMVGKLLQHRLVCQIVAEAVEDLGMTTQRLGHLAALA
jgi:hypothetical protein